MCPNVVEALTTKREKHNEHDRFAIAVMKVAYVSRKQEVPRV